MADNRTSDYSILLTDDDPLARAALRDILAPEGFNTLEAESGEEALDIVQQHPVHLGLFDMHMKTLTGLETLQIMRQSNVAMPCILVTADATTDLVRRALNATAYSVIPKPVARNVVLYTVVRALGRFYGGLRPAGPGAG